VMVIGASGRPIRSGVMISCARPGADDRASIAAVAKSVMTPGRILGWVCCMMVVSSIAACEQPLYRRSGRRTDGSFGHVQFLQSRCGLSINELQHLIGRRPARG